MDGYFNDGSSPSSTGMISSNPPAPLRRTALAATLRRGCVSVAFSSSHTRLVTRNTMNGTTNAATRKNQT